jgi:hypothetical protein
MVVRVALQLEEQLYDEAVRCVPASEDGHLPVLVLPFDALVLNIVDSLEVEDIP